MNNEKQFLQMIKQHIELNDVQLKAVTHKSGPLLLLASPGSGKTTTIITRIAYLMSEHHISAGHILAVSFSKASAHDLLRRYKQLFPMLAVPNFSTIHSLAYKIMRTYYQINQIPFHIIEGANEETTEHLSHHTKAEYKTVTKHRLLAQLYEQINKERIKEEQLEELITFISLVKNKCLTEQDMVNVGCSIPHATDIYIKYEQIKKAKYEVRLVDYDDLLSIALEALQQDKHILNLYQQQFKHILTDESQDTSIVQHHIIKLLVKEHEQLFVVADDDQAIYSWRGADVEYLLQFKQHYPRAEILFLQQNYRSTQKIVEAANTIIKQNKSRYVKTMITDNGEGKDIIINKFTNGFKEVSYIADLIQNSDQLSEIAILYRNHMSNILLINELDKRSIPFYMKDADDRFFNHWIIQDIINILRLSYSDKHFHIFEAVANKLQLYISNEQLQLLKAMHTGESIFIWIAEQLKLESYQKNQLALLQAQLPLLKQLPPKLAITQIRELLGYNKVIKQLSERLGFKYDYLMSILDSLELIADGLKTTVQFVDKLKHLEAIQKQARFLNKRQAVTLSTLHSAKGLEFNTVFMMDLNEGVIPSRQDSEKSETMEEAVRLFYVGMTRARHTLYLLSVDQFFGQSVMESRFVKRLKPNTLTINKSDSGVNGTLQVKQKEKPNINKQGFVDGVTDPAKLKHALKVEHKQFGQGKIICNDGNKLNIAFEQHGKKTFLASVILDKKMIREME